MLKFGNEVKDKITGFKGIIIGKVEYITGCDQYLIQPKCKKDGIKPEAVWFDVDRLQVVSKKAITYGSKKNGPCDLAPVK